MTSCDSSNSSENEKSAEQIYKSLIISFLVPFQNDKLDNMDTVKFLDSSKGVVNIIERMGKVFAPIKYDMTGNIEKLTRKYLENPNNHKYLQEMILTEKSQGKDVATDALMWLRRGLQFFHRFIELLIEDSKNENKSENISRYLKTSYSDTLQRYHGWMAHKLFNLLYRMCPTRSEIFFLMSLGVEVNEEHIVEYLEIYNGGLCICLQELVRFYTTNELENHARV